jgi:cell division protein FtsB
MANGKRLSLNLASHALRNRRFFFALLALMVAVFLAVSTFSTLSSLKSRGRAKSARAELASLEKTVQKVRKERDQWTAQVRDLSKKNGDRVGVVNDIILHKTFPWVDFFSRLEEALPAGSYISSMAPLLEKETTLEARFRAVSPNLNELLKLIEKLNGQGFKDISVRNETQEAGLLVSEILVTYARTF